MPSGHQKVAESASVSFELWVRKQRRNRWYFYVAQYLFGYRIALHTRGTCFVWTVCEGTSCFLLCVEPSRKRRVLLSSNTAALWFVEICPTLGDASTRQCSRDAPGWGAANILWWMLISNDDIPIAYLGCVQCCMRKFFLCKKLNPRHPSRSPYWDQTWRQPR